MTLPAVTMLTTGLILLLQIGLMAPVIWLRRTGKTSLGDGERPDLLAAVRRHGNLAEVAALFLLGLALLELSGGPVAIPAAVFVMARVSHAIGLSLKRTANVFRTAGVIATVAAAVTVGVRLLWVGWNLAAG